METETETEAVAELPVDTADAQVAFAAPCDIYGLGKRPMGLPLSTRSKKLARTDSISAVEFLRAWSASKSSSGGGDGVSAMSVSSSSTASPSARTISGGDEARSLRRRPKKAQLGAQEKTAAAAIEDKFLRCSYPPKSPEKAKKQDCIKLEQAPPPQPACSGAEIAARVASTSGAETDSCFGYCH